MDPIVYVKDNCTSAMYYALQHCNIGDDMVNGDM